MQPGSVVSYRQRYWVVLPNEDDDVILLRPLSGNADQTIGVHKRLSDYLAYSIREERIEPGAFPLPRKEQVADVNSAMLLWQAARLNLREGAAPLRSLGRISIRPRTYQFVPLLMALRLDPVRLFIADDVGVGKTIEAGLIARELWDRKEINRIVVFCPPYLCDQWQQELSQKFNLEAQIFSSGTINRLERSKPNPYLNVYETYPIQVASIDFIKLDRNKDYFFTSLTKDKVLVIVDEAHGAAQSENANQQLRHKFLRELAAKKPDLHLILLTATPHSGIESAFRSLLGLLDPQFEEWNISELDERKRRALARYYVQRTRKDIESGWESKPCFPQREVRDETYSLSDDYKNLYNQTYDFCKAIVKIGDQDVRQRVRNWGALNLLRCVMSSPKAALAALEARRLRNDDLDWQSLADEEERLLTAEEQIVMESTVEPTERTPSDETLGFSSAEQERQTRAGEARKLSELKNLAQAIIDHEADNKLKQIIKIVRSLLKEGFAPIVWCYYVNTAEYVGEALKQALETEWKEIQVLCISGRLSDEERRAMIDSLDVDRKRALVATDCLSEGINLQEKFNAALHYDLPWNPNRLEQREGRIDRYGQLAPKVRVIRYYGRDNIMDGEVLKVLLNKAAQIYHTLGTHVPIPVEEKQVINVLLQALFFKHESKGQMVLPDFDDLKGLHAQWDISAQREKEQRTRFAQLALKPQEVERELEEVDAVLGDPQAVKEFLLNAAQRLELPIAPDRGAEGVYVLDLQAAQSRRLPEVIRYALPAVKNGRWKVSFQSPTPIGAEFLGRNHRFIHSLAQFAMEEALAKDEPQAACRGGVMITRAVPQLTLMFLLRVRYLIEQHAHPSLFAEEVRLAGFGVNQAGDGGLVLPPHRILKEEEAKNLLISAKPEKNMPPKEKQAWVERCLQVYPQMEYAEIKGLIEERAKQLQEAHRRLRSALSGSAESLVVKPQLPADVLGVLVLVKAGDA